MASSSKRSANLLGKRKPEDGLETKPFLKRHKEKETTKGFAEQIKGRVELSEQKSSLKEFAKTLFVANLSPQTEVSDIVDFFKDVGEVVSVRLRIDQRGKHLGYGFVEFASAKEANEAVEQKNGEYLRYWKIILDQTPDFFEEAAVPKKTLFIGCLSRQAEISDIIDFFKDVGQVVRVRLIMQKSGRLKGIGFVEFASAYEAKKALQKKNGEYLFDRKIFLDLADRGATYQPPRYCIDHKVWYEEDYLQRESLPKEEEEKDAAVERLDETPEEVLLIANLSPQTTEIEHIINFFEDVGEVVCVRLIVNHKGKHVGYGFVEFATANEAKKALQEKNGKYLHDHKIMLMKGLDETPGFVEEAAAVRNKTVFVYNLSPKIEISDIISFFKDVGEVVHVRLVVDHCGDLTGSGYVEFASANEATKALERKGEYIDNNSDILVDAFKTPPYTERPKYCIDHKVWYEDYLERESLLTEDVEETPDFAEEAVVRKKTVFVDKLCKNIKMQDIVGIFKGDGEVIRVRLIVDRWGKHVGCCFVELATANVAEKAVQENRRNKFFVTMAAEIDDPYPFRPKYNLAEKLWYEDNLRRKSLCDKKPKPNRVKYGTRTTFSDGDS